MYFYQLLNLETRTQKSRALEAILCKESEVITRRTN